MARDPAARRTTIQSSNSIVSAISALKQCRLPFEKRIVSWSISYMVSPEYILQLLRYYYEKEFLHRIPPPGGRSSASGVGRGTNPAFGRYWARWALPL